MAPTLRKALELIRKHHPDSPAAFVEIGLPLDFIGGGAFRETAKVKGLPLVAKFPLADDDDPESFRTSKLHTTNEVNKVEILSTFRELRPYLPKIYYHNRETGVMVMRHYPKFETDELQFESLGLLVRKLIKKLAKIELADLHTGNYHKGRQGKNGVIIDLGY